MLIPAHCHNYLKKSSLFLPGAASEHLPCTLYTPSAQDLGIFQLGRRWVSHSAQKMIPFSAPNDSGASSAQKMIPFSAQNPSRAPSAQEFGCFSARQANGIPFRAGNDTFFCSKCLRGTFRAGLGAFFCSAGGWKFQQLSGNAKTAPECTVNVIFSLFKNSKNSLSFSGISFYAFTQFLQ